MALDDLNSFADRINGYNRDKTLAMLNMQNVVGTNGDADARSMGMAGYTQVPPQWSTPENRADAERKGVAENPDVAAMPPVTARFFANPGNAAVAHDDIGTLARLEDLAKNGFGPHDKAPLGPRGSLSTLQFGTDRDRAEADYLAREYGTKPFWAIQGGVGKLATRLAFPVAKAVDAANGDDYYQEFASQLYDTFSLIQRDSAADPAQTFGGKLVRSVQELVPMVLSGGLGLGAVVGQATNDTYDSLAARGVDPDTALALAMKSGMAAYAMTKLPLGGKSLTNSLARGATLNPAFGALDRALEKAGLNYAGYAGQADDVNPLDPEALAHDLALGLLFGAHHALQAGRPAVGSDLMESLVPFYDQYRAARRANALTGIGTVVRDSRLNNRAPDLVQRHLDDVAAEHAGIENAYVPVERWNELFRSAGLDPAHVAGETLSNPGAYHEALRTGADIVIPFGEFTGKLSGLEQYGELVKDARLSPEDVSLREAEAHVQAVKDNADGFMDALKNVFGRSRDALKGNGSYRRVYDDLMDQQVGIGTERGTAEHNASLVATAFRVLGERAGVDPYELYSNYNLKLTRPMDSAFTGQIDKDMVSVVIPPDMAQLSDDDFVAGAKEYARKNFANTIATNRVDGSEINIPWQGIKHAFSGKVSRVAAAVSLKLKDLIEEAQPVRSEEDKKSRNTIRAVHHYSAKAAVDGEPVSLNIVVREHNGKRYYDHYEIKRPAGQSGELAQEQDSNQPFTGRSDAISSLRRYPATSRAESILSTLHSTAKTGGENNVRIVEAPENVKALHRPERPLVAKITGKELSDPLDSDNVVAKAREFFKENLQGRVISRAGFGDVRISGKGWEKVKGGLKTDLLKARLIPAIPDIIKNGEYHGREGLYKDRKDDVVAFHFFSGDVLVDGKKVETGVTVAEDSRGGLFYNLNHDTDVLWEKLKAPRLPGSEARGAGPSRGDEPSTLYQSISNADNPVNIKIFAAEEAGSGKKADTSGVGEPGSPIHQTPDGSGVDSKPSGADTLLESVVGHLAVGGVRELYQSAQHDRSDKPAIVFRDGAYQVDIQTSGKIDKGVKIVSMLPRLDADNLFDSKTTSADEAIRIGTEYYHNELEGHPVEAPAFRGEKVSFTNLGLAHLTGKHEREISTENIARRLKLLPKTREVLATAEFADEVRIEAGGNKYGLLGVFNDGTVLRVVVQATVRDGKVFLTAYDWEDVSKKIKQLPSPELLSSVQVKGVGEAPPSTDPIKLYQDGINVKDDLPHDRDALMAILKDLLLSGPDTRSGQPAKDSGSPARSRKASNAGNRADGGVLDRDQKEAPASVIPFTGEDLVKKIVAGAMPSAITRIKTAADAAHIAFPLTKRAQEAAIAIVTDAKGKVLGIVQHSTGALENTTMSPRDLLGVVHDFPGAAEVWFAHNHPSGDPTPSSADRAVTTRLAELLDGSGIRSRGQIVVGRAGGAAWIEEKGGKTERIPLDALHADKERTRKIKTYDRELVQLPSSEPLFFKKQIVSYARSLGTGATGIIVVDAKLRPVAFVPMSLDAMARLKTRNPTTGSSSIMSAFHKANGAGMILIAPVIPEWREAVRNMVSFGDMFGGVLFDVVETRSGRSFREDGRLPKSAGYFFQSASAPVSHDFVRSPDGRYVFGEITPEIGAMIRRQSAPILLRRGNENEGKIHIERPERLKQIQREGYDSAEKLVDDVVANCGAIYKGERSNLLLARKGTKNTVIYVQLEPSAHGDYYDVKTAVVTRGDFFDKKKPLWERAQTNPAGTDTGSPLRGLLGQSGFFEIILSQAPQNVKRGFIRFDDNRNFEIRLLKDADLSTFIHESGHFFAEVLGDLAERADAPPQIRDDYAALIRFAGVDSRADIRTEHHEKIARAFEAYIREGHAPSMETRSLFRRMKAWMIGLYKDLSALNIRLTPRVREVFDRMLATDAEIGRMSGMQNMRPLFATAGAGGMSPAEFDLYRKDAEQAGELAKEELFRKLMAEKNRERESWWRDEQAALRNEAMAEAQAKPVYRALQEILKGRDFGGNPTPGLKLDRDVLVRRYGGEFLKGLPKGAAADYLYAARGGAHPELVAERYGFSSADEMVRAMMATPPLGDFVAAAVDARMKERHGDLLRDGRMGEEAMKALHNDRWAGVLRTEIKVLRGKGTADGDDAAVPSVAAFRQTAREQIGAKPVGTIDPLLYLSGERKAAREASDLCGTGDFDGAAAARVRQLLNHFLYAEAAAALGEADAIRTETGRWADHRPAAPGLSGSLFREQMGALLVRFGLADASHEEPSVPLESLRQFLDRLRRDEGIDLPIPAAVLNEQRRVASYRELPMDVLRAVSVTLRMIEHAADVVSMVRKGVARVMLGDAEQQLVERFNTSIPVRETDDSMVPALSFLDQLTERASWLGIPIIRPEALFERMDGPGGSGPWHDLIWNPCYEAGSRQNQVRESLFPAIFTLIRGKGINRSKGEVFIEGLGGSLTRNEIMAMALNCGNERNLDLLMRGGIRLGRDGGVRELSPSTLLEILGRLNADEIMVVNGVWKAIETLKPEIEALLRRQTGVEPAFLEARPMEVANGTLAGGLYPVAFAPGFSNAGEVASEAALLSRMFLRDGMEEGSAAPLSLDLENVVVRQLDRVVTRITHGEAAAQAKRLLRSRRVKEAIVDRLGEGVHKNLLDWANSILDQDTPGRGASDVLEQARRALHASISVRIVSMAAADVASGMVTAASIAMQHLDVVNVVRGSFEYMRNPAVMQRFAIEASGHMRRLDEEIGLTMTGSSNNLAGRGTLFDDVQRWVVESRAGAARVAAMMAWISGYREAQTRELDGMEAVHYADKALPVIRETWRAGRMSAVERTARARELAMLIGPAILRYQNPANVGGHMAGEGATEANRSNSATPFLFGVVVPGILKECLNKHRSNAEEAFLPWFLSLLLSGLIEAIPYPGEPASHEEGMIAGEKDGRNGIATSKAILHAVVGTNGQATATGHYLHGLLSGDYDPGYLQELATEILSYRRHQQ